MLHIYLYLLKRDRDESILNCQPIALLIQNISFLENSVDTDHLTSPSQ